MKPQPPQVPGRFDPPSSWLRLRSIDVHTAGEPLRVIVDGFPQPKGATMLEKRSHAREHSDALRRAMMWEPRGHADMYGCLLTAPVTDDGDMGVLFLHNEGFSTMCGHGIIGLVKVVFDCGMIASDRDHPQLRIDTPAGRVLATAHRKAGIVQTVSFLNVASFVLERDLSLEVEGLGRVRCDIAFGGAFYAYVEAQSVGLRLADTEPARLIDVGRRIKRAVMEHYEIIHPDGAAELNFLYGTVLVEAGEGRVHSRNVCVFADGELDRSPTGTGVSGRAAIHHARGELKVGDSITIESIIGTRFDVTVKAETRVGDVVAIVPEVSGAAHITGVHDFYIDPDDPLGDGFLLR